VGTCDAGTLNSLHIVLECLMGFKFHKKITLNVTNLHFYWVTASVDTSSSLNTSFLRYNSSGSCPRCNRVVGSAAVSSCQHWLISPFVTFFLLQSINPFITGVRRK
jgi:hypothetical protein